MKAKNAHFAASIVAGSLSVWLTILTPAAANAVPVTDFTGHSENLTSVVNFAVLPPGDRFTSGLTPYYQAGDGFAASLNPQQLHISLSTHKSSGPFPALTVDRFYYL